MRHITGSSKVVEILNGLGHSVSYPQVLEHDTALAEKQASKDTLVPESFKKNIPATVIWDNDFKEQSVSGKGTTHNTNGILIQRGSTQDTSNVTSTSTHSEQTPLPRNKRRTVHFVPEKPQPYFKRKRIGPEPMGVPADQQAAEDEMGDGALPQCRPIHSHDSALYLAKLLESEKLLPGWTGFNILLEKESGHGVPSKTNIGYLPVIDASPTELSTVNAIFEKSLTIADELELDTIVLVYDQALYSKAQQVRWNNDNYKRTVLRLGEFHTTMSFLSVIGKRFPDAGLVN